MTGNSLLVQLGLGVLHRLSIPAVPPLPSKNPSVAEQEAWLGVGANTSVEAQIEAEIRLGIPVSRFLQARLHIYT